MKRFILMIAVLFMCQSVMSQISFATNITNVYDWDSNKQEWILLSTDNTKSTLFEFNKDLTMLKHTTSTLSSTYYIKSVKEDKVKNHFEYGVVSDVGNKYTLIVDFKNYNIRFIGKRSDGSLFLIRHTIKQSWIEEG